MRVVKRDKLPKTRVCRKCGKRKLLINFHKKKDCRFGYSYTCLECENAHSRQKRKNNPEKYRKYDRNKYLKYKDIMNERGRLYYKLNKVKFYKLSKLYKKRIRKERPWVKHYNAARDRCHTKTHNSYKNYGARGIQFLMTTEDFKFLWFRDKAYLMKRPSIHRINNDGNYELSNCCFIELTENIRISFEIKKKG